MKLVHRRDARLAQVDAPLVEHRQCIGMTFGPIQCDLFALTIAWNLGALRLSVRADGPDQQRPHYAHTDPRWRRLSVVAVLSRAFGVLPTSDEGKVVWAVLNAARPRSATSPGSPEPADRLAPGTAEGDLFSLTKRQVAPLKAAPAARAHTTGPEHPDDEYRRWRRHQFMNSLPCHTDRPPPGRCRRSQQPAPWRQSTSLRPVGPWPPTARPQPRPLVSSSHRPDAAASGRRSGRCGHPVPRCSRRRGLAVSMWW